LKLAKANVQVQCLYVKPLIDVSKEIVKECKEFEGEGLFFLQCYDDVKDLIADFILNRDIDVLTMLPTTKEVF
jgi:hypothetical protein